MKKISFLSMIMLAVLSLPFICACGSDDDDDAIDTTPIQIYSNGEKVITGADAITSSNEFVAYTKGNKVTAFHIGETMLTVNGKYKISLTVKPLYNLYDDPVKKWGCSQAYVKSYQKQGKISSKSTDEMLIYENAGGTTYLAYMFKNGKLSGIAAIVSTNHTSTLAAYLAERYLVITDYEGENTYFYGIDGLTPNTATTVVMTELTNTSTWTTYYVPFTSSNSRETRSIKNDESYKESVKRIMDLISE